MIALEKNWKRPCLSADKGERFGSTLEKLGGGMGLPIRDPDLHQHLKDKKTPHEIPGFSLSQCAAVGPEIGVETLISDVVKHVNCDTNED